MATIITAHIANRSSASRPPHASSAVAVICIPGMSCIPSPMGTGMGPRTRYIHAAAAVTAIATPVTTACFRATLSTTPEGSVPSGAASVNYFPDRPRQAAFVQFTSATAANFAGYSKFMSSHVIFIVSVVTARPSFQKKPPLGYVM